MSGYIGINNVANKIKSLYIGINGLAKKVNTAYIGVNGIAKRWYGGEYESKSLGTWNTSSDVDTFFNTYTPDNNWSGLKLGNYVSIKYGGQPYTTTAYYSDWEIAGFDLEHNQIAADGTTYDNGRGLCMIPKTYFQDWKNPSSNVWNSSNTLGGAYYRSTACSDLHTNATILYYVLGDHLVERNVLLSNSCAYDEEKEKYTGSDSYTWTTAYLTLMSVGQLTGTFASHRNKYDDGEANYYLPLFNYENYWTTQRYWLRNIYGTLSPGYQEVYECDTTTISSTGYIYYRPVTNTLTLRPMMYLR